MKASKTTAKCLECGCIMPVSSLSYDGLCDCCNDLKNNFEIWTKRGGISVSNNAECKFK